MHKVLINEIISSKDLEKYNKLGELFIDEIDFIKDKDYNEYETIEDILYEIAEGRILNEEKSKHIIENMKPYGMHWTLEQTESVRKENSLTSVRPIDFWIVMNMAYNDYHELFNENLEDYVKYSKLFILDSDAEEDKVYTYFTEIPRR